MKPKRRQTIAAVAGALGKNRKTLQRWRRRPGAPFDSDGACDLEEVRAWAQAQGLLERTQADGRRPDVERLVSEADEEAAPPVASFSDREDAIKVVERVAASLDAGAAKGTGQVGVGELTDGDKEMLTALLRAILEGNVAVLVDLATKVSPQLLKKLAAMGRTRRELAEAEKKELENRKSRRELVPIEEVRGFWTGQIEIVKTHFTALPGKLAPRLVSKSYDEIYQELESELHALLEAFAQEVPT